MTRAVDEFILIVAADNSRSETLNNPPYGH
jgi:hypothetical protein